MLTSQEEVECFCAWTKKRFYALVSPVLKNPAEHRLLSSHQIGAIKSWIEAGDVVTSESHDWPALRCYFVQTLVLLKDCGRLEDDIVLNREKLDLDLSDEILNGDDPFEFLKLQSSFKNSAKCRVCFVLESLDSSPKNVIRLAAAFALADFYVQAKKRIVTEETFRKILNNPPDHVIEFAKNGGAIQNGQELITIHEGGL